MPVLRGDRREAHDGLPEPVGGGDAPPALVKKECMDCAKLPEGVRPKEWRPLDKRSGPRSPRCFSHREAIAQAGRVKQQDENRMIRHGMSRAEFNKIAEYQGGKCPCGRPLKHIDHDRKLAKGHGHPRNKSCRLCWRGLLCSYCNSYILGRGYNAKMLRGLADYEDDPPVQRMREEEAA